jgi:DNA-directed RNA polymerase specialized sigma24 family protein
MNNQTITPDSFEALLSWLGATRDEGARKYEAIRGRLIRIFLKKGCTDPEDLADVTINRVTDKVASIRPGYVGDPANYFCGVARIVYLEYRRRKEIAVEVTAITPAFDIDLNHTRECLHRCLSQLPVQQRDLVMDYYVDEKRAKIDSRQLLALELDVSANALRIRAHRIRVNLEKCVAECIGA